MKATKKIAALLPVILVLTTFLSVGVFADTTPPAVWDGTADTTWFDPSSKTKTVTLFTAEQLAGLSELSKDEANLYFMNWTIKLGADIVLNTGDASTWGTTAPANAWTPVTQFWGTFDGQGYTISGMYINNGDKEDVGFISVVDGGIVKNVSFVNSYVVGGNRVGAVVGKITNLNAEISNVYSDAYVTSDGTSKNGEVVGGLIGDIVATGTVVKSCWFDGEVLAFDNQVWNKGTRAGGIAGRCYAAATLTDCLVTASVKGQNQCGGIVGAIDDNDTENCVLENCLMLGTVEAYRSNSTYVIYVGEFAGIAFSRCGSFMLKNCYGVEGFSATLTHHEDKANAANTVTLNGSSTFDTNGTVTAANATDHRFAEAELKGDGAAAKLVGFDFTNVWKTVADSTPVIAALEYEAANKTSGQDALDPEEEAAKDNPTTTPESGDNQNPNNTPNNSTNNNTDNTTTETPTTNAPTTDTPGTDTSAEEKKGGCGSTIAGSALVSLMVIGSAVMFGRRKED